MTNKEYKAKLNHIEYYTGRDYLRPDEVSRVREDLKALKKSRGAFALEGFNGRAVVIPTGDGYTLRSYDTDVISYEAGTVRKLWDGYSVTTLKHINAFCAFVKHPGFNKREWIELN